MTDPVPRTGPTRAFNRMARKLRSDFFVRFPTQVPLQHIGHVS